MSRICITHLAFSSTPRMDINHLAGGPGPRNHPNVHLFHHYPFIRSYWCLDGTGWLGIDSHHMKFDQSQLGKTLWGWIGPPKALRESLLKPSLRTCHLSQPNKSLSTRIVFRHRFTTKVRKWAYFLSRYRARYNVRNSSWLNIPHQWTTS